MADNLVDMYVLDRMAEDTAMIISPDNWVDVAVLLRHDLQRAYNMGIPYGKAKAHSEHKP